MHISINLGKPTNHGIYVHFQQPKQCHHIHMNINHNMHINSMGTWFDCYKRPRTLQYKMCVLGFKHVIYLFTDILDIYVKIYVCINLINRMDLNDAFKSNACL